MKEKEGQGIFYGWVIVAVAFISMAIAYALRYSFSVFSVALEEEFGWSRAGIHMAFSIVISVYGFTSPISGSLFDRYGPRIVFPAGAAFLFVGLVATSQITQLWHLYLCSGIAALGVSCLGYVTQGTLISNWFVRRRGTAAGAATSGTGFGMFAIVGLLLPWVIQHYGFRWGYAILGSIALLVITPLTAIFLCRRPEEMGLLPDGDREVPEARREDPRTGPAKKVETIVDRQWAETEWTLTKALKTLRFWAVVANLMFFPFGLYAVMMHQVQHAVDVGFSITVASSAFALVGLMGTLGKFGWGFLSDYIGREMTYTLGALCNMLAILLLMSVSDPSQLWLLYAFSLLFGLSYGIAQPLITAVMADLFQGPSLGRIFGSAGIGVAIGGALGPVFSGYLFDTTGSYHVAFAVAIAGVALAAGAMWVASPRKVRLVPAKAKARALAAQRAEVEVELVEK
ncbi:MAG: MFS transporter [Nitrospinae bacterium]|nr:MFS transporter [Nitrospinota bacterium]